MQTQPLMNAHALTAPCCTHFAAAAPAYFLASCLPVTPGIPIPDHAQPVGMASAIASTADLRRPPVLTLRSALQVVGVQPLSTVTRHTCTFYPLAHPLAGGSTRGLCDAPSIPRCVEPMEVLVQLQGSGEGPCLPRPPLLLVCCCRRWLSEAAIEMCRL